MQFEQSAFGWTFRFLLKLIEPVNLASQISQETSPTVMRWNVFWCQVKDSFVNVMSQMWHFIVPSAWHFRCFSKENEKKRVLSRTLTTEKIEIYQAFHDFAQRIHKHCICDVVLLAAVDWMLTKFFFAATWKGYQRPVFAQLDGPAALSSFCFSGFL